MNFYYGIALESSSLCELLENSLMDNIRNIYLYGSFNVTLGSNNMSGQCNLDIYGWELPHFIHTISDSNVVNDKPVYYFIDCQDAYFSGDAGYLAFVNSNNITIESTNLENNGQGLLLAYTNNSFVARNNMTNNYCGVVLVESSNNTINGNNVTNNGGFGIQLYRAENNSISSNNIRNNGNGIQHEISSNNNEIFENQIASNSRGIYFSESSGNSISRNNITSNWRGIEVWYTSINKIFHNNFIDNSDAVDSVASSNMWDDGYPSGGNCWSDYIGIDEMRGPEQDQIGSDTIGDTPYVIDGSNQDAYPLMKKSKLFIYEHDLSVHVRKGFYPQAGQPFYLNATVTNIGLNNQPLRSHNTRTARGHMGKIQNNRLRLCWKQRH